MALAQTPYCSALQADDPRLLRKLVIVTELIAPYRIPVFNALAQRKDVDLHVIFLSETDPTCRQWHVYKNEIKFQYQVLPSWRGRVGKFHALVNRGTLQALSRILPDVILCGGYNYLASWQTALWARFHRVPILLWTESTAQDRRSGRAFIEFLKTRFMRLCNGFVVPGSASAHYLNNRGIANERIFHAANAVDIELFSEFAQQSRKNESQLRAQLSLPRRYLLYVGRLVKEKGLFDLLEAYARLDVRLRGEVGLVLVGDGPDRLELMRQASRITPGIVQFAGFVQRDQLPAFYALAETLILPTHSDTWGLVVNEAMSCALPIIVTSVAGCARDLVKDGWNGCVVPPADSAQLSSAMSRVLADFELRRQMGIRSRQIIQQYSPLAWSDGIASALSATRQRIA